MYKDEITRDQAFRIVRRSLLIKSELNNDKILTQEEAVQILLGTTTHIWIEQYGSEVPFLCTIGNHCGGKEGNWGLRLRGVEPLLKGVFDVV